MMGEIQETMPCAALTEKRPNRLSGCVGVFFQLFDWNRRFAKKKLFSRKSLLPGKQPSKRFGGTEKMLKSKLSLIDDENRGSFPNRGEVVEFKKHDMRSPSLVARLMGLDSIPSNHRDKGKNKKKPSILNNNVFDGEEDNGFDKSRPQKMQRTLSDGRIVAKKFGSDAMQIKNVLTRVRKHHQYNGHNQHQKLASPVRSPRLQRRNSRLIEAAARILEPGLHAKRNAKALTGASGSSRFGNVGKDLVQAPDSLEFGLGYSNGVASCKACGSFVDVHGSTSIPAVEEIGKNVACVSEPLPFERCKRNVFWNSQEPSVSASGKGKESINQIERKALHRALEDEMARPVVRNQTSHHKQVLQRERFPPEVRSYTFQSKRGSSSPANAVNCKEKDFIAMNRGSPSKNHHNSKSPVKCRNSELSLQRKSHTRVEETCNRSGLSSPARKRRLDCVSGHERGSSSMSSVSRRLDGERSCDCINGPSASTGTTSSPLKFGFPRKHYSQCCREPKERREVRSHSRQTDEKNATTAFQKRLPLDPGTLGFIQQKLKELAFQEEDETNGVSAFPNKTDSLILHELLSSLTLEQPYAETINRRKGKRELWNPIGNANSDYTSPGSVLDASFSNESCFSNSVDNISVPGPTRLPLEPIEPNWDALEDSATNGGNYQAIASLIRHVSNVLHCLSNTGLILTKQRFTNAREVIIHTELSACTTTTQKNYLIGPEIFDELMIYAARSDILVNLPGLTGGFLVDAMIEHLEQQNISCGLKPSSTKANELIRGVLEEVPNWTESAVFDMDEVFGTEMDLQTHSIALSSELAYGILWCLVAELATDLGNSFSFRSKTR